MLLLRASGEINGRPVDLRAVTGAERAAESGVSSAAPLIALADAVVGADDAALAVARRRVVDEMSPVQLVDAVAVASNFERMVRVADATGIPLDGPVEVLTSDVREGLGINRFTAAANTPAGGILRRMVTPLLRPLLGQLVRIAASRAKAD